MSIIESTGALERYRGHLDGRFLLPGDAGYDAARTAWNLAVDQRPAAVALPHDVDEVVSVVRIATQTGHRVAPQSTGHAAASLAATTGRDDVILVNLREFTGVEVDPAARRARIAGGTLWRDVIAATAPHGLTAQHGSAGDVAVAGYILSGGLSFYGRKHGLAVNSVRALEIVTADGALVRASAEENAALYWAVRGGSGALGVVTAIEIELLPYADAFAGMLLWDASRAEDVVLGWCTWAASAPESATTSLRIMHFPPIPELPPFLSGRSVVVIDGVVLEDDARAAEVLGPLRALAPELDTFGRMPASGVLGIHMDPPQPTPSAAAHAMLGGIDEAGVRAFVTAAGPGSGVMFAELRHAGGAFARDAVGGGALSSLGGAEFAAYALAMAPVREAVAPAAAAVAAVMAALRPWQAERLAPTFVEQDAEPSQLYGANAARLADEARRFDPQGVFAAAHRVR